MVLGFVGCDVESRGVFAGATMPNEQQSADAIGELRARRLLIRTLVPYARPTSIKLFRCRCQSVALALG